MKTYITAIALAFLIPGTAVAEDISAEYIWSQPTMTGGIGPQGNWAQAGDITGTYSFTVADGTKIEGTAHCVGMDENRLGFNLRMSCDMASGANRYSTAMLCVWRGEAGPDTPLSCVGYMTGKAGTLEGRGGMITMNWYAQGKAHVVSQWWPQPE